MNLGIEWNAENQLVEILENETTVATFEYDPLGRRVEKVAGGTTTAYTYDGADILRQTAGGTTTYYVHGPGIDEPLAKEVSGSLTYYHADALGSVLKMTNASETVTHEYRYDAYGRIEAGSTQGGYAFTGREWDPEIGLYYYRARYYDSQLARFISEDPVQFEGGVNFYAYVGGTPTEWRDPFGLAEFPTQGTLPGTNIPYRMDMRQQPFPNMHVYWEGTKNGPQTIVSHKGGWTPTHGSAKIIKPLRTHREALKQVTKSFLKRCSALGLSVVGNLATVAEGLEADAARELRAAERNVSTLQQAWDDSVEAGTPGFLWSPIGLIPVTNPGGGQIY